MQVDDTTYHRTKISTQGQNPEWPKEEFITPYFTDSRIEVIVEYDDERLGEAQAPIRRLLGEIAAEKTYALKLVQPELDSDDPNQYTSSVTLHMMPLSPFIADSLPQYHLPPTPSSCLFLDESLLAGPVFNPSPHDKARILSAWATVPPHDEPGMTSIRLLDSSLVVKCGGQHIIREAMAIMYIRQQTSIPVPTVHWCFQDGRTSYLVMDRVKGRSLDTCLSEIPDQHLKNVVSQLAGFIQQLRKLGSRKTMGSWPSGPYDNVLFDPPPLREFHGMQEFQAYWIYRLGTLMGLPEIPSALREVGEKHDVVLAHGDLAPRNIMVDDGEITGIIDWETLGWYPDFWELMMAAKGSSLSSKWKTELSMVFGQQPHFSDQYERVLFDVFFRQWT